jgi:glucose-6-phosphate isomerase
MTTDEILAEMNDKIDPSDLLVLKSVLDTADLAKFAKHETSFYERESHIKKVFVFLSNTKDESLENPKPTIETIVLNDGIQRRYRIFLALGLLLSILGSVTVLYYVLSQLVQVYSY